MSVDSGGAIVAAFSVFDRFTYQGRGVYVTVDTGMTWTKAGLDSVFISGLASFGTTTYAYTYDHGLYVIDRTPATGVAEVPAELDLKLNYPIHVARAPRSGTAFRSARRLC